MQVNINKPEEVPNRKWAAIRNDKIRGLYRDGFSMDDICKKLSVSKTTVFFAINHKYGYERRSKKNKVVNINQENNNKNNNEQ